MHLSAHRRAKIGQVCGMPYRHNERRLVLSKLRKKTKWLLNATITRVIQLLSLCGYFSILRFTFSFPVEHGIFHFFYSSCSICSCLVSFCKRNDAHTTNTNTMDQTKNSISIHRSWRLLATFGFVLCLLRICLDFIFYSVVTLPLLLEQQCEHNRCVLLSMGYDLCVLSI